MVIIPAVKKRVVSKKGFSLIECLVSILLLSIVLLGGMGFYFYSDEHLVIANHRRAATELANARMEQIIYNGYFALPNPAPASPGLWQGPTAVNVEGLIGQQNVYIFDVNDDADAATDFKRVRVRITWNEPKKAALQEVMVDTYIAP